MATDKHGNTLMRGDTVMLETNRAAQVAEPLTNTAIVTSIISEEINPATCEMIAAVDGRGFARQKWVAPINPAQPGPPPAQKTLLSDNFDSGSFSTAWTTPNRSGFVIVPHPTDPAIVLNPRTGNCARVHYRIDSTQPAHHDHNQFLWYIMNAHRDSICVEGDVLIPANVPLRGVTRAIQRKLIYIKSNYIPDGREIPAFGFMLTSECLDPSHNYITLRLGYGGGGGNGASLEEIGRFYPGRWTKIAIAATINTPTLIGAPNTRDGIFRLFVDGAMVYENLAMDFRSYAGQTDTVGKLADYRIAQVEVGRQVDRLNSDPVDEDRYWDNIEIS